MLKRNLLLGLVVVCAVLVAILTRSKSVGQPAATQPTISVSPQAQTMLDSMRDAYSSLKTLTITGTVEGQFDIDGSTSTKHGKFSGLYNSPGLFRSEVSETEMQGGAAPSTQPSSVDTLMGNSGKKLYVYLPGQNGYAMMDLPPGKIDLSSIGEQLADVLRSQDLSLALAVSGDAGAELLDMATHIGIVDPVSINGASYPTIVINYPRFDLTLSVDPKSHLVDRTTVDLTKNAKLMGASVVKKALLTTDFTNQPGAAIEQTAFEWTPPAGAQQLQTAGGGAEIENKPAPSFSLIGLDGKQVTSQSLKGSVYVIDFWATWCGPCVASLPTLDQIYKDYKDKGVKFFAANQQEDKDTVQKFVSDSKLSIPVLMDTDGSLAMQYDPETAIPFTAVVGKDGIVLKAGLLGADENQIRPVIDSALKK